MPSAFATFGKIVGDNKESIQNFGIVGITIASEEISSFIFFFCPCDFPRNQVYGTCFIWGPAFVLLVVGYLASRRTWRLTTGLCNRTQSFLGKGKKRIFHFIYIFCSIGMKAMIAPATWVVLAFLKGDYYACAHWPNPYKYLSRARSYYQLEANNETLPKPCLFSPDAAEFNPDSEAEIIARTLRAESHIIGWFYLTIGMFISVVVMFTFRCYSRFSYEQSNYIQRYRQNEIKLFEEKLDEKSKELAQHIVDKYFSKRRSKQEWDRIAVINDKVTRCKRGKAIYSPLHRFVNKELNKIDNEEAKDAIISGNLVQDVAIKKKSNQPKNENIGFHIERENISATTFVKHEAIDLSDKNTQKIGTTPIQKPERKSEKRTKPKRASAPSNTSAIVVDETARNSSPPQIIVTPGSVEDLSDQTMIPFEKNLDPEELSEIKEIEEAKQERDIVENFQPLKTNFDSTTSVSISLVEPDSIPETSLDNVSPSYSNIDSSEPDVVDSQNICAQAESTTRNGFKNQEDICIDFKETENLSLLEYQ